jgi:hypothetical protein
LRPDKSHTGWASPGHATAANRRLRDVEHRYRMTSCRIYRVFHGSCDVHPVEQVFHGVKSGENGHFQGSDTRKRLIFNTNYIYGWGSSKNQFSEAIQWCDVGVEGTSAVPPRRARHLTKHCSPPISLCGSHRERPLSLYLFPLFRAPFSILKLDLDRYPDPSCPGHVFLAIGSDEVIDLFIRVWSASHRHWRRQGIA